jgi:hypothetical protein
MRDGSQNWVAVRGQRGLTRQPSVVTITQSRDTTTVVQHEAKTEEGSALIPIFGLLPTDALFIIFGQRLNTLSILDANILDASILFNISREELRG